jgi:diadenylate cyclase|uniref:Diadenylate cyclase n=1 Tax=candidate division WOR-3 bacterium TaxID=2052148 RepID=A0A7V3PT45_UNCW3
MLSFIRLKPVDIIDILLVAIATYYFLRFIRGTRAIRMLYALLFLIIVGTVARWLDFKALGLIVSSLTTVWLVAFVILFQPEIRNLLSRFGRARPIRFLFRPGVDSTLVEELIAAAATMKERKIGALIVIEQEIGLREYTETGTRLEARVSAPLLVSIFTPPTPLHDGAVIISGNQIIAAGCILPLGEAEPGLGLRHRAAAGITAITDAVAIVVSETTGNITFARRGRLLINLTPSQLKYNLMQAVLKV